MNRWTVVTGLFVLVIIAVGIKTGLMRDRPPPVDTAVVYSEPRDLPEFELSDHHGHMLGPTRFGEHWDILFFGFTRCPDICPMTLHELSQLRKKLKDLDTGQQPHFWLVTVDPERDTADVLARYLSDYGDAFSGITGSEQQIAELASWLGVSYLAVPDEDDYTMAHTAALFLVDRSARLVASFNVPFDLGQVANDYRVLTQ